MSERPGDPNRPGDEPDLRSAARLFAAALARETRRQGGRAGQSAARGGSALYRHAVQAAGWLRLRGGAAAHRARVLARARRMRRRRNAAARPESPPRRRRLPRWAWIAGLAVPVLAVIAVALFALSRVPDLETVQVASDRRIVFTDADGGPLLVRGGVPSEYAATDAIPAVLRDAVLAIEDQRFFEHGGLDLRSILRAGWRNFRAGEVVEGGSTLTQQLVKVSYLEPDRTFQRKLQEAALTLQLERALSKDEILTRYLNAVYMGAGATGMPAAARVYFDADLADLTPAQAAALAATIRTPSAVNPRANLDALRQRAALVLDLMETQGRLDPETANAARAELATLAPVTSRLESYGGWFADWLVDEADRLAIGFDGVVTLRTSLEPELQKAAEEAVAALIGEAGPEAEVALIALRPNGRVAAMVGGRDYETSQYNRATMALRSPGSTFKTFVYYAALARGVLPSDRIEDRPVEVDGWSPKNFGGRYAGRVTVTDAFARSLNAAAVRLALAVGLDEVAETARALGIEAELSETPALALGASGVTLLDMVEAYASIASGVMPITARGITGVAPPGGDPLTFRWPDPPETERTAALLSARDNMIALLAEVVRSGTGKAAALPGGALGKTGTSQEYRDALFIGWNSNLVAGVWIGRDDNAPLDGITGGDLPARLWRDFMLRADPTADVAATQVAEGAGAAALGTGADQTSDTRAPSGPVCNVAICERRYRSFRASDCTFQPYRGPRKLCTR